MLNTLIILEVKFYSPVLCEGLGLGLETKEPRSWSWSRDQGAEVLVLVSRPGYQGLALGLETKDPRSWSWSRDQSVKVLVFVSSFFKKVLTTTLVDILANIIVLQISR